MYTLSDLMDDGDVVGTPNIQLKIDKSEKKILIFCQQNYLNSQFNFYSFLILIANSLNYNFIEQILIWTIYFS